jgi:hypothetical protein
MNLDAAKALIETMIAARACGCGADWCDTPKYPWAPRLDAERVLEWMKAHRHQHVWALAELEALVKG